MSPLNPQRTPQSGSREMIMEFKVPSFGAVLALHGRKARQPPDSAGLPLGSRQTLSGIPEAVRPSEARQIASDKRSKQEIKRPQRAGGRTN